MHRTSLCFEICNFTIFHFWLIQMKYDSKDLPSKEWLCGLMLFNWIVFEIN